MMMNEASLLLLFDENRPCWSARLVELAGEDPGGLKVLEDMGLLLRAGKEGYVLSESGKERFRELAKESFLEALPGNPPSDLDKSLFALEVLLCLDRGFHSPWGSKDARTNVELPYYPVLPPASGLGDLSSLERHPLAVSFSAEFSRTPTPSGQPRADHLREWVAQNRAREGRLHLDILFLHRYDYTYYMDASSPADPFRLMNTDRLLIRLAEPPENGSQAFLEQAARDLSSLRPFLEYARRFLLPGRFDTDTQEQSSVTWWVWTTRTREEARRILQWLSPFAETLIGPSAPLDFWILSLEALEGESHRHETFFELFESAGIPVARTA
jgi:hypothetical protein